MNSLTAYEKLFKKPLHLIETFPPSIIFALDSTRFARIPRSQSFIYSHVTMTSAVFSHAEALLDAGTD